MTSFPKFNLLLAPNDVLFFISAPYNGAETPKKTSFDQQLPWKSEHLLLAFSVNVILI
jgi:hypothetical protein